MTHRRQPASCGEKGGDSRTTLALAAPSPLGSLRQLAARTLPLPLLHCCPSGGAQFLSAFAFLAVSRLAPLSSHSALQRGCARVCAAVHCCVRLVLGRPVAPHCSPPRS